MPEGTNLTLLLAALLNAVIGLLHLAIIVVGPLVCLGFGLVHLLGVVQQWPVLS
ncbi:hypothetical protein [Pseudomonas sp. HN2-3]|uniref:hypothetical protein n=1 Tax=Pseudomonas sp. HN2-3 TaxID=2886360 RepID=UPI001D0F92AC|nr:hypothetical protein [Pseudomonas sp. HN2-3]UDU82001.1 hypothetical protein LJX93_03310 [Pseudomonas sp. HN2-3]